MSKWLFLFVMMVIMGCGPSSLLSRYPAEDRAVYETLDKLTKNAGDNTAQKNFTAVYAASIQLHRQKITSYESSTQQNRWEKIMNEYAYLNKIADAVDASPVAARLVKTHRFHDEYSQAREQAAATYYDLANTYLERDDRSSAKQAYDLFKKTNQIIPGYKDVKDLMNIAEEKSTLTIVINPVNYYAQSYGYWGLNNDYVQYELTRDLRYQLTTAGNNIKVYTDREAYSNRIKPDRIVDISWNELFMPQPVSTTYTRNVSQQVQTGETADKKPVYTTVTATIYITSKTVDARGTLSCRIIDPSTNRTIMWDNFPGSYMWREEYATYRGDSRALSSYDWALINNANFNDPQRRDIFSQVLNQVYPQLINRIRSVTWY